MTPVIVRFYFVCTYDVVYFVYKCTSLTTGCYFLLTYIIIIIVSVQVNDEYKRPFCVQYLKL